MFNISDFAEFSEFAGVSILFFAIYAVAGLIGLVFFFLQATGIYKMGKQLGVSAPWLSFIPFPIFSTFAFGRIASKYIKRDGKKSANFGVWLLVIDIIMIFLLVALIVCLVIGVTSIIGYADNAAAENTAMTFEMFSAFIPVIILYVVMLGIAITYQVIYYVAMWRIFSIFSVNNADLFLVLSVFFPIIAPIFIFIIKNNKPTLTYPERMGFENL